MTKRSVRLGSRYRYKPCVLDQLHPCSNASPGDIVQVCKPYGCPPPNTMGQCHIQTPEGTFLGMVSTASLIPVKDWQPIDSVRAGLPMPAP